MNPAGGVYHKTTVMDVLNAALAAADPYQAVFHALTLHSDYSHLLSSSGKLYVVGAGKAGAAMSRAVEAALGKQVTAGLVIVKDGYLGGDEGRKTEDEGRKTKDEGQPSTIQSAIRNPQSAIGTSAIRLVEAGHPVPDSRGVEATSDLLRLVKMAGEGDLVVCLISGGGSALLTLPAEDVELEDVQIVTSLLLRAGATINELNAVRKHLSGVSGGQLARIASPARVLSLILSDVTGSPLDVIASGPTVPDPTTFSDALLILARYGIVESVPRRVLDRLKRGEAGEIAETPKPDDPVFANVTNLLVASNVVAVEAAANRARELDLNTSIISTYLEGEARVAGHVLAGIAREVAEYGRPLERPACLLFGGETTVTVRGSGSGGRNTELALSAALALDGLGPEVVIVSLATDGGDGVSPSAGGIVDGTTIERGKALGLDARASLDNNDSYTFLSCLGDALMTGPTGTNVNDIMAVFVFVRN
jgi:glycerate 2-kinase